MFHTRRAVQSVLADLLVAKRCFYLFYGFLRGCKTLFATVNKQPTDCDTSTCLFMPTFWQAILTHNIGQTDLVFVVQSGFICRSVHARLQVSVCAAVMICASWLTSRQTHRQHLTSLYEKLSQLS